jgi:hypothetical protein
MSANPTLVVSSVSFAGATQVPSSFETVDKMLNGGLVEKLRSLRAEGMTLDQMVRALAGAGIPTSRETLRRWCREARIPTHRVAAAVPDASDVAS